MDKHNTRIYNIKEDLKSISEGELLSVFLPSSIDRRKYLGREIIDIFGEYSPNINEDVLVEMIVDMTNLILVLETNKGTNVGDIEVLKIPETKLIDILKKMMKLSNTGFLITYLGNILF